jgi:1-acyl-sn-glycerol-3-phosphate acyltransferase
MLMRLICCTTIIHWCQSRKIPEYEFLNEIALSPRAVKTNHTPKNNRSTQIRMTTPYSIPLIICRIPLLLLWIFFLVLPISFIRLFNSSSPFTTEVLPRFFHWGLCKIFGLRLSVTGHLSKQRSTLYIANHVSYLDLFLLGSIVPGYFVAKSEVSGWPLLGKLARLQNTIFIERNSRRAREQIEIMQRQLAGGHNLILFPEGTSTEGAHVEPFKSSLFHATESKSNVDISIQSMTLAYTHHKGLKMTQPIRDYYAWYATMPFLSHFIQALGMRNADIELIFHAPVRLSDFGSRKACAEHCWSAVNSALSERIKPSTSHGLQPDRISAIN